MQQLLEELWIEEYGKPLSLDDGSNDRRHTCSFKDIEMERIVAGIYQDRDWLSILQSQYIGKVDFKNDEQWLRSAFKAYEKFLYLTATRGDFEDVPGPAHPIDLVRMKYKGC